MVVARHSGSTLKCLEEAGEVPDMDNLSAFEYFIGCLSIYLDILA